MLQQILAVFLVLGLLLAALWLLKRHGLAAFNLAAAAKLPGSRHNTDRRLRVLERVVLTPQHSLHLVSIDNRVVVFAASPAGCSALDHHTSGGQDTPNSSRNTASC